jgi:hypothetical protein
MEPTTTAEVRESISELTVGQLYSNDDIFRALRVSNAGGIRLSIRDKILRRAVIMTSIQDFRVKIENPYHDRLEGEVLTYTAGGRAGAQTLAGINSRLIGQRRLHFPIHGFVQVASRRDKSQGPRRWQYLGLLQYLRHYPDRQLDSHGKIRQVWLFEFKIHTEPRVVPLALDEVVAKEVLTPSEHPPSGSDDDEVVTGGGLQSPNNIQQIENVRSRLLALEARTFEFFIKDLLLHCGFTEVCVTKFSADGGIDVNAKAGARMWLFADTVFRFKPSAGCIPSGARKSPNCEEACSLSPEALSLPLVTSRGRLSTRPENQVRIPLPLSTASACPESLLTKSFSCPNDGRLV